MDYLPDFRAPLSPLPTSVRDLAERRPDAPALVGLDEGRTLSWSGIHLSGLRWAEALRRLGVEPGERVATMLPQSVLSSEVWLGCAWRRAIEFPMNTRYKGEWLRHALATAQARVLVIDARYCAELELLLPRLPFLDTIVVSPHADAPEHLDVPPTMRSLTVEEALADAMSRTPDVTPALHDTACALFTSGTTGATKAVILPWAQFAATFSVVPRFEEPEKQVYYVPYGPFHMTGKGALHRPALTGGHAAVRETMAISGFLDEVRRHGITWTWMVPLLAHVLHNTPPRDDDRDNTLDHVLVGPIPPFIDELRDRFGFRPYSGYGSTELGTPFYLPPSRTMSANYRASGVALPGVEAIVADEFDDEVPHGRSGELLVRAARPWVLSQGYVGEPEKTLAAWRNGWFHTGDCFRRNDNGEFEFVDRTKDTIRIKGENLSSSELENAILSHGDVRECAAVAVPSEIGEDQVLAVVVVHEGRVLTPESLVDHLRPLVPAFALPRYVRFADSLARTAATDRVQKFNLREEGVTDDTWDRLHCPMVSAPTT